ncbi:MAG: hypothetical protein K0Q94_2007, partial [Paenibacillus sp.]|nr:hypothetical protein [Paenibacillus sp.]
MAVVMMVVIVMIVMIVMFMLVTMVMLMMRAVCMFMTRRPDQREKTTGVSTSRLQGSGRCRMKPGFPAKRIPLDERIDVQADRGRYDKGEPHSGIGHLGPGAESH